ncbi:hypothetical protein QFZ63_003131 [Streptomyces sp. B3I7]|uniref:hypothetical protein n=1 Tax=Streptomyces sp. B3I7 TaxID=3042269 RepID=UPI0027860576|nr:hypothetical protein [Streptomyces sp. B3I7]MDQ0811417.1 hypothetical protein [Streptomyces sp. B3I7]
MDRADQLVVLSGAAADQWGLVTTAQAKELGLNAMPQHVDIKAAWLRLQPRDFHRDSYDYM